MPSLINVVQADLFSGKVHEDASAHLQNFLEKGATISIKDIPKETIILRLFAFSLKGRARQCLYSNEINTSEECSTTFLSKFFPTSKTNALRGKITNFQQQKGESIPWDGNVCKNIYQIALIME
jgi:hypothetical protein